MAPLPPSKGRDPFAPIGPLAVPIEPLPLAAVPPALGDRGRLHAKQSRLRAKFGQNPQCVQVQSPTCAEQCAPAVPRWLVGPAPPPSRFLPLATFPRVAPWPPPELPRGPPPPPLRASSTRLRRSRRPCTIASASPPLPRPLPPPPPPPPPPRRCGMAAAPPALPPPPWWDASRLLAASSATRALADWRARRARLCQDCSPRAVAPTGPARPREADDRRATRSAEAKRGRPRAQAPPPGSEEAAPCAARHGRRRRGTAAARPGGPEGEAPGARPHPAQLAENTGPR